ncbi:MAG TPA: hypothetical protein VF607_14060, partial [Verrucomicrobiae bacterium]
ITVTNLLWEFDPVEVMSRPRPTAYAVPMERPEQTAFAQANVDISQFQNYLRTHNLALIVSRDVTTRDHADRQQPFNLRVTGTTHTNIGTGGKIYDVSALQLFQADQLRSLNYGNTNSIRQGRRVLAQYLHDPAVDNPPVTALASVGIAPDGSTAALVPARRAMTWQLTDSNQVGVVRERYWITFQPGEIRTCTSCHGINETTQAGHPTPTNTPLALVNLLTYWKTNNLAQPATTGLNGTRYFQVTFNRHPAESGITYHVQLSTNFVNWQDIASYAGTNIMLTTNAVEVSRSGNPNERVVVRENTPMSNASRHYLRVLVSRP